MLKTAQLTATGKLALHDYQALMRKLSEAGWHPAIWESEQAFVEKYDLPRDFPVRATESRHALRGDVFFRNGDTYYCIAEIEPQDLLATTARAFGGGTALFFQPSEPPAVRGIEIGLVTADENRVEERLRSFATLIDSTVAVRLDIKNTPGPESRSLAWAPLQYRNRLKDFLEPAKGEEAREPITFQAARLDPVEVKACEVLADSSARLLARDISQAVFVRERDLLAKRAKESGDPLRRLEQAGLVEVVPGVVEV